MKTNEIKYGILAILMAGTTALFGQSETDATRYARTELGGSARFQSMAGAMGAVGVDYSSTLLNPAGLALSQRPLNISVSLAYDNIKTNADWLSSSSKQNKNRFGIREFSISGMTPISNDASITYGFGYSRLSNYHSKFLVNAENPGGSLADYVAATLNNMQKFGPGLIGHNSLTSDNYDNASIPWMAIMGYEGGWINSNDPSGGVYYPRFVYGDKDHPQIYSPQRAVMEMEQSGTNNRYDANMAFNIEDKFFIGLGIFTSSIDYTSIGHYTEYYLKDESDNREDYLGLDNYVHETGFGGGFSLGMIYAPIPELRFGVAYYTPTWYSMKRNFDAIASSRYGGLDALEVEDKDGNKSIQKDLNNTTPPGYNSYDLKTPGKVTASVAAILGSRAILSFDYEYSDLGNSKLSNDEENYSGPNVYKVDNQAIKEDYGGQHTYRIGAELRATQRLSLRAGYMTKTAPVKNKNLTDFSGSQKQEVLTSGTTPAYILQGKSYALTGGLGYRITPNWTADIAVVWQHYNSHLVTFPYINDYGNSLSPDAGNPAPDARLSQKPINLDKDQIKVLATLTYRF